MRRGLTRLAGAIGLMALFAMMLLTFADVVARYLFAAPIYGAVEIIEVLLAMMILAGLVMVNDADEHIVVELFSARLARWMPRLHYVLTGAVSMVAMGLMTYGLALMAIHAAERASTSVVLAIPLAWVFGLLAALAAVAFVLLTLTLLVGRRGQTALTKEDAA